MYRRIWQLAWPMILTNITVPLLGLVDAFILGHLPKPDYLAAVALGATIITLIFWSFGFLRMGTTALIAQAFGRQAWSSIITVNIQGLLLALGLALGIGVAGPWLIDAVLGILSATGQSMTFNSLSQDYCYIRLISAPAVLGTYVIMGACIGCQQPRITMYVLIFTNIINMLLDMWFVWGLGYTSSGVAWATVCAEYMGFALAGVAYYAFIKRKVVSLHIDWQAVKRLGDFLTVNRYLFVRTLVLLLTFLFIAIQTAKLGAVAAAANGILLNILAFIANALDGFAFAAEALAGELFAAKRKRALKSLVVSSFIILGGIALCFSLLLLTLGKHLIFALTSLPEIQQQCLLLLPWLAALPVLAVGAYLMDGVFIGLSQVRAMQMLMLVASFLIFLPIWFITQPYGIHGIWFSLAIFLLARSVLMTFYFKAKIYASF